MDNDWCCMQSSGWNQNKVILEQNFQYLLGEGGDLSAMSNKRRGVYICVFACTK